MNIYYLTKIYFDPCYNLQIVNLPLEKVIYIELEKINWIDKSHKVTNLFAIVDQFANLKK